MRKAASTVCAALWIGSCHSNPTLHDIRRLSSIKATRNCHPDGFHHCRSSQFSTATPKLSPAHRLSPFGLPVPNHTYTCVANSAHTPTIMLRSIFRSPSPLQHLEKVRCTARAAARHGTRASTHRAWGTKLFPGELPNAASPRTTASPWGSPRQTGTAFDFRSTSLPSYPFFPTRPNTRAYTTKKPTR